MFDMGKVFNREAFFLYSNSSDEKSLHSIVNLVEKDDYIQGFSVSSHGYRTFRRDRIIRMFDSLSEMQDFEINNLIDLIEFKKDNEIRPSQLSKNNKLEICFTGFEKKEKDELSKIAELNNLKIRFGVTSKLTFLCCGPNAGWRKIEEANSKGSIILSRDQFKHFVSTGEIPYESIGYNDGVIAIAPSIDEKTVSLRNNAATTFNTIRSFQRGNALIAQFVDGYAIGWKFAVKAAFRDALDIKLTSTVFDGHKFDSWTQGNKYSFQRGNAFYSDRLGYTEWPEFLKLKNAVVLQIKYDCFAGYETIATLDGVFSGRFIPDNLIEPKELVDLPLLIESQSYDHGTLTIEIFRPTQDKTMVELVDTITMNQDELISLLQTGCYWKKEKGNIPQKVDLLAYDCN